MDTSVDYASTLTDLFNNGVKSAAAGFGQGVGQGGVKVNVVTSLDPATQARLDGYVQFAGLAIAALIGVMVLKG